MRRTATVPFTITASFHLATSAGRWRSPQSGLMISLSAGKVSRALRIRWAMSSADSICSL
jgi:hypothetical protein